jgi:hypothetical protein
MGFALAFFEPMYSFDNGVVSREGISTLKWSLFVILGFGVRLGMCCRKNGFGSRGTYHQLEDTRDRGRAFFCTG